MNDIENAICDTIDLVIEDKLSKLHFNKTIECWIMGRASNGYMVSYQGTSFIAYPIDETSVYHAKDRVFVMVPNNDMSTRKLILCRIP